MKFKGIYSSFSILSALAVIGVAHSAHAQSANLYEFIILDQTGSMTAPGTATDPATGNPYGTRWEQAVKDAAQVVTNEKADASTIRRAYSVWTFNSTTGLRQVWPAGTVAVSKCVATEVVGGITFCLFGSGSTSDYNKLTQALSDCSGATPDCILQSYAAVVGPATPLSQTLCSSITSLKAALPSIQKAITLESDGEENQSTGPCYGDPSAEFAAFNYSITDWGMTPGSWENRVIRRLKNAGLTEASAVTYPLAPAPGQANPLGTDFIWNVGVHYDYYPPSTLAAGSASMLAAPSVAKVNYEMASGPSPKEVAAAATMTAAPVSTMAAAATTGSYSIPLAELATFRGLGKANTKSKIREFIRQPGGTVFGMKHTPQADVSDDHCIDNADFNMITQSDVWMKRAVLPNQIAIRADVTRDGWVDFADRQMVLDNWGKGCINPPGPKPKI